MAAPVMCCCVVAWSGCSGHGCTQHPGVGKQLELQEGCGKYQRLDAWQAGLGGGVGNTREISRPALFSGL